MKTFKQFFDYLLESKHSSFTHTDGTEISISDNSPPEHITAAINHPHAGTRAFGARHSKNPDELRDLHAKEKDWWVHKEIAKNPNTPDDVIEKLKTHKRQGVIQALIDAGRMSSPEGDSAPAPSSQTKTASEKSPQKSASEKNTAPAVKGKIYKLRSIQPQSSEVKKKETQQQPVAQKAESKPATKPSGISVVKADPEDHGLPPSARVSHVKKGGKFVATAISNTRPAFGELDKDTEVHQAFVGDHTNENGLRHIGDFKSHEEALIAAAKAHAAKKS